MNSSSLRSAAVWVCFVLALATGMSLSGGLSLLVAVPPGYATAVFPPAGIALAAVLMFGYRLWPGVFLGAIAVNAFNANWTSSAVLGSLSVGIGSTLQALLGAWLIRRFVGFPTSLDDERSIGKFFILGGPVSCVVAATWGLATLWLSHNLGKDVLYNWYTWWMGDSIGVVIFAPLMLIAFGRPREVWRTRALPVGLPLIMACAIVVGVFYFSRIRVESATEVEFNRRADIVQSAVARKIESYQETLHSVAGLYRSSDHVDRFEFRMFVERAFTRQPGLVALGWIPRIASHQLQEYEQEARDDASKETNPAIHQGLAQYQMKKWVPGNRWVPYDDKLPAEIFPVHYIEPFQRNERALGIDLASQPARRVALKAARDTDRPVATAPILLAQETGDQLSILLVVPVIASNRTRETLSQRRDNLLGFASAVIRIRDIIETACSPSDLEMVELSVIDASVKGSGEELLYGRLPGTIRQASTVQQLALLRESQIEVGGRTWQLQMTPSQKLLSVPRGRKLWGEVAIGAIFTLAVGSSLLLITGRNRQIEMLVTQRTDELRLARFAMDNAGDPIFWVDERGRFHDVNQTACDQLEYSREQLLRMSVWDIDLDYSSEVWAQRHDHLRQAGRSVFEASFQTKSGTIYPVEISTGFMDFGGEGYHCAIARDITERKEAEERLRSEEEYLRDLLDLQERERQSVALDIHDGFVQYIVGAMLQVETLRFVEGREAQEQKLAVVRSLMKKAIAEARRMISDLRPMVIDESGIVFAIEHLLADEKTRGLEVTFEYDLSADRFEPMLESAIFRIVQEALNNVRYHGQVDEAAVSLSQQNGRLEIVVQDRGVGFEPENVSGERFGLRGIRERARLFGGQAEIDSTPGEGTQIRVQLPATLRIPGEE